MREYVRAVCDNEFATLFADFNFAGINRDSLPDEARARNRNPGACESVFRIELHQLGGRILLAAVASLNWRGVKAGEQRRGLADGRDAVEAIFADHGGGLLRVRLVGTEVEMNCVLVAEQPRTLHLFRVDRLQINRTTGPRLDGSQVRLSV